LNPGSYATSILTDLSHPPAAGARDPRRRETDWLRRVERNGEASGLFADYRYYGTGDMGGAPNENSVKMLEAIVTKSFNPLGDAAGSLVGDGPLRVVPATSEQMFLDIRPEQTSRLPRYQGDLELTNHSAGSLTSQAYVKRWNRQNETLADAAERASVAAEWLGARPYPIKRLTDAWTLVMGGQFHDLLPGTAIPTAYEFTWNDEVLALNQFAGVLTSATEGVAAALDTQAKGFPVVVFNSLNIPREDVVEAQIPFIGPAPGGVRVVAPDGSQAPAQISGNKVLFVAKAPADGYAVYDVQPVAAGGDMPQGLRIDGRSLENQRYRITLDPHGDVASVFDKVLHADLLLAPIRLEIKTDFPSMWPAWNMDWTDQSRAPRTFVGARAGAAGDAPRVRIVENGPARVALEVSRKDEGSTFVETVRLSAGDGGNRIEFVNAIDWNTRASHLKAVFPLAATNPSATYNWDVGTIQRGNDTPTRFEMASHQWVDLTDRSGKFGATILADCKNGSDKPDDNTLRLTLLRTPGTHATMPGVDNTHFEQGTQDVGHHEFVYGLVGHPGSWQQAQTDWQAYRLNQPMSTFVAASHPGALGKTFSLLTVNNSRLRVLALKRAENSNEVILRLIEIDGKPIPSAQIAFAGGIASAREVNGAEEPVGPASIVSGKLTTSFSAFQLRSFALKLAPAPHKSSAVRSVPLVLPFDVAVSSRDRTASTSPGIDGRGNMIPAEMLPASLSFSGVNFQLAPADMKNALTPAGQQLELPPGRFDCLYLLAAGDGDQQATFGIGSRKVDLTIQDWSGFIGQWDDRIWKSAEETAPKRAGQQRPNAGTRVNPFAEMVGLRRGFIKRDPVAWFSSHHHTPEGANQAYSYSYLFCYRIEIPENARTLVLPANNRIRILAISAAQDGGAITPAAPLYDTLMHVQ